ncbi:MAG TPA: NAD(P)/FAD-dependent oxidoreductase [Candidatus Limnocylindrales bacterium]|nr:NAD(P)/FAD-dependent oxidoreductase [Candidatus Limnocylindrales bacterium]
MADSYEVVVVGAGPNGLTAATCLARAGYRVLVMEAKGVAGGGCRTAELTLPKFHHDVCAAIHPMGLASPVFRELELERHGLEWVRCPLPLAHAFSSGSAAVLERSLEATASALGRDGPAWRDLLRPFVDSHDAFFEDILRPIRWPKHPLLMARFGAVAVRSCANVIRRFHTKGARALFAGCAAHSFLPLEALASASFGLALAVAAHAFDWPCARGGSQAIVDALLRCLCEHGGALQTDTVVRSLGDVPESRAVLFDLTPRQIAAIAGEALPSGYRRRLERFRYGPGVFKIDWALRGPIPWKNPDCRRAATVHIGESFEEIAASEDDAFHGRVSERPFVLVAQQSLFDATRAPAGQHTGWAYCHMPHGCDLDVTARIEQRIEACAPGFRDQILARHVMTSSDIERHNANMIGGDIGGGANVLRQFLFRPVPRWNPYTTPNPRLFLCSSSTPPGGGVHGMCGYWAAQAVLRRLG